MPVEQLTYLSLMTIGGGALGAVIFKAFQLWGHRMSYRCTKCGFTFKREELAKCGRCKPVELRLAPRRKSDIPYAQSLGLNMREETESDNPVPPNGGRDA